MLVGRLGQGCIELPGPRAVPACSSPYGSRTFWIFEHPGVFLSAVSRDGSRSAQEPGAALRLGNGGQSSARGSPAVSPLLTMMRVAWMTTFRVVRGSSVLYLDTLLEAQLHKQDRLETPGRFMGDSPGIHGRLLGTSPASAGPSNMSHAYRKRGAGQNRRLVRPANSFRALPVAGEFPLRFGSKPGQQRVKGHEPGAGRFSASGGGARAPGTDAKLKSGMASAASVPRVARKALTFPLSSG